MSRIESSDPATVARPRARPRADDSDPRTDGSRTTADHAHVASANEADDVTTTDGRRAGAGAAADAATVHGNADGATRSARSVPALLRELRDEAYGLVQQELLLARSEIAREVEEATGAIRTSVMGAVMLVVGLVTLAIAASAGLYAGLLEGGVAPLVAGWLSPLIVAVLVLIIGGVMVQRAKSVTSPRHWRPDRTEQSLRETREWAGRKP